MEIGWPLGWAIEGCPVGSVTGRSLLTSALDDRAVTVRDFEMKLPRSAVHYLDGLMMANDDRRNGLPAAASCVDGGAPYVGAPVVCGVRCTCSV
ncbi:hypothetical protein ACLOJK_014827 [Asimina triloba]